MLCNQPINVHYIRRECSLIYEFPARHSHLQTSCRLFSPKNSQTASSSINPLYQCYCHTLSSPYFSCTCRSYRAQSTKGFFSDFRRHSYYTYIQSYVLDLYNCIDTDQLIFNGLPLIEKHRNHIKQRQTQTFDGYILH